jgi:hypothetical protein
VELLQGYARLPSIASDVIKARRVLDTPPTRPRSTPPPVRPPHALRRRLGDETIQELIAAYQDGSTTPELVVRYQVSKGALLNILHEQGLAVRKIGLSPEEIDQAFGLRASGLSYAGIGERLGVVGSTVWRVLQTAEVS